MNKQEILARAKKSAALNERNRKDQRYIKVMGFLVAKGFLYTNRPTPLLPNARIDVEDAIWAGQKVEPRILEVLPAGLKCTHALDSIAPTQKPLDDLIFVLDENQKKVLLPNNKPFPGKQNSVSKNSASVRFSLKDHETTYDIDRITGKFRSESKFSNGPTVRTSGNCEKRNVGENKF
jgi:hypothetical protein